MLQRFKNVYHLLIATVANTLYQFPSRKMFVIGVTGTDGKTTTTSLIYHILKTAGKSAAMVTTVGAHIGNKIYDTGFHTTTPSSLALQRYIKNALGSKSDYLVLEVTSHALHQHRVAFIPFQIGVITNVTHEHLDYHKTYENYVSVKTTLLQRAKTAIINHDDESYALIRKKLKGTEISKKIITYGMSNADITPKVFPFKTNLVGEFNQLNSLAAISVARELKIPDEIIRKALLSFKAPPGRQELVYDKEFKVMIDFAHTPHAFETLLPAVRKQTKGRLIHVFGSAGERDHTKRPLMGKAASENDDIIILTAEDPRSEIVASINAEIRKGIKQFKKDNLFEIPDRKEAIEKAISIAKKGDYVVITGKSHESSMNMGHGEEPWDEFATVRAALKNKNE